MSWVDSLINAGVEVLSKEFTLTSNWGSLNSQLIAMIAPCDKDGAIKLGSAISAPATEANISQQFNWTSPFENYSVESKNPTLAAMLQTGMMVNVVRSIGTQNEDGSESSGVLAKLSDLMEKGEGRTGITKLNSMQVFTGHEPMKIDVTLAFRAYADPLSEVAQPIQALWEMAFPKEMADGKDIVGNMEDVLHDVTSLDLNSDRMVKLIFPSEAPTYVAFKYRGVTYAPMVIENISRPLVNPTCALGDVFATVQIGLGTQRSWDTKDIQNSQQSAMGKLVSDTVSAISNLF